MATVLTAHQKLAIPCTHYQNITMRYYIILEHQNPNPNPDRSTKRPKKKHTWYQVLLFITIDCFSLSSKRQFSVEHFVQALSSPVLKKKLTCRRSIPGIAFHSHRKGNPQLNKNKFRRNILGTWYFLSFSSERQFSIEQN